MLLLMANFLINLIVAIAVTISLCGMYLEANANTIWTKETYKLNNKLQELWMDNNLSEYVINKCKETAKNPRQCVITASMIAKAESNMWKNAYKFNVWGINEWKKYPSVYKNFDRWLKSYNKHWFKSPLPSHYYSKRWKVSKTRYCTSENSSKSNIWCPNWLKHSTYIYNILIK